jgi:dTDP-4-amino-4,6-dideoxygalactose transaminase
MSKSPIMRPRLPTAEQIAPYLGAIDAARIYSNFGPLALSLEHRLAMHFGVQKDTITTTANATQGLLLALTTLGAQAGTLCVMPAWTFIASAHAAIAAGLTPYFVDVDPETWALQPSAMDVVIDNAPAAVGAVMPVVPFGQPIDFAAWDAYRARTRLPVVIDAAAGFDSAVACETPVVVSLHATKVIGSGEGGFVLTTDETVIQGIRARTNFGFLGSRDSIAASTNAKLSEYHAAVAHASLDEWANARADWMAAAALYRKLLPESNQMRYQRGFGISWIASTCLLHFPGFDANKVEHALADAGVETRRWWGQGAHLHRATSAFPRSALPETELLADSTLSVPFYRDIEPAEIEKIAGVVRAVLSK